MDTTNIFCYDDCLNLNVCQGKVGNENIEILISALFSPAQIDTIIGSIRYGIRRGMLTIHIANGYMPLKLRNHKNEFTQALKIDRELFVSRNSSSEIKASFNNDKAELERGKSRGNSQSKKDSFEIISYKIQAGGNETKPFWTFSSIDETEIMSACIENSSLGFINWGVNNQTEFTLSFSILKPDIIVLASNNFNDTLSSNKSCIIRALVIQSFYSKHKFEIVKGKIQYTYGG
jgi:hypothetical protein